MKKRAVFSGGLGFIGSHAVERFKNDYDLIIIDNKSTNVIDENDPIVAGCSVIIDDLLNVSWDTLGKVDLIVQFADHVGPFGILQHAGQIASNTIKHVEWAKDGALKNDCLLVQISTSEIYGHREKETYLKEIDDKVYHGEFSVRNEYSCAKLLSEMVLTSTAKAKPLKYQIVRPFNVSGARQKPDSGFVLPRFVVQALKGETITVFEPGTQRRAFTHVKDIVEGIWLVAHAPHEFQNQAWNIGNMMNTTSIRYLADKVRQLTSSKSLIGIFNPKEVYDNPNFEEAPEKIPDASKIMGYLNWRPTKKVEQIIQEVVDFYRGQK